MDQSHDFPGTGRPPRNKVELLGPRPAPLKVRKESHKIKKPPVAPVAQPTGPPQQPPQPPPRQPVIIYAVSPKVIHANPSEFMTLVQRLTGPDHSTSSSLQYPHHGAISPAARLASIEKTKMPLETRKVVDLPMEGGGEVDGGDVGVGGVEKTVIFPGILSPGPGSIPPISPNFFSPLFRDPNTISFLLNETSAIHRGNRNCTEGSYLASSLPSFFSPNTMFSPNSLDLLHQILNN